MAQAFGHDKSDACRARSRRLSWLGAVASTQPSPRTAHRCHDAVHTQPALLISDFACVILIPVATVCNMGASLLRNADIYLPRCSLVQTPISQSSLQMFIPTRRALGAYALRRVCRLVHRCSERGQLSAWM